MGEASSFKSAIPGIIWPGLADASASCLMAVLFQLEQSQWWPPARLAEWQNRQLHLLLAHAYEHTPYWRRRMDAAGLKPTAALVQDGWSTIPISTRTDLQEAGDNCFSRFVPPLHGSVGANQTSGSTGRPLTSRATQLCGLLWNAITMRDHFWHRRDFTGRSAIIRAQSRDFPSGGIVDDSWGTPARMIYNTGPCAMLNVSAHVDDQWRWLKAFDPHYLLTHPTNLRALADHAERSGERLGHLRQVRTIGEMVTHDLRQRIAEVFGLPLIDMYSAQEIGYLALQCPQCSHYHIQSELVRVEVLDDHDQPCGPGECGRMVITRLHNFAMPLVRYDIGDYAEVAETCPCGRGLTALRRIIGRQRNLLALPGGRRIWPVFSPKGYLKFAPVKQMQIIQHTLDDIEVRIVVGEPLTSDQHAGLATYVQERTHPSFHVRITRVDNMANEANHKFEDFISHVKPT